MLTTLVPNNANAFQMTGLTIGPNGNLFVAAVQQVPQIFQYNPATGVQIGAQPFVFYEGTPPSPDPHDVIAPQGLRFSPLNQNLYVADQLLGNVHVYSPTGTSLGTVPDSPGNFFSQPGDVAFDAAGNLYVANPGFANVLRSDGGTQTLAPFVATQSGGLNNPGGLTFGPDGKLYVLDTSNSNIYRYNADGSFDNFVISLGNFQPGGLAFGPDDKLYVSGTDNSTATGEVERFLLDGTPDGVVVSGLTNPLFMTFTPVPEPTSTSLAGLVAVGLLLRPLRNRWRRRARSS